MILTHLHEYEKSKNCVMHEPSKVSRLSRNDDWLVVLFNSTILICKTRRQLQYVFQQAWVFLELGYQPKFSVVPSSYSNHFLQAFRFPVI
jgi:hypothetical protein